MRTWLMTASLLALTTGTALSEDLGFSISLDGETVAGEDAPIALVWPEELEPAPAPPPARVSEAAPAEPETARDDLLAAAPAEAPAPIAAAEATGKRHFGMGIADMTLGARTGDLRDGRDRYWNTARAAFLVDGRTEGGLEYVISADTGEEAVRDLGKGLGRNDPLSALDRFEKGFSYPTFGDDSQIVDSTPTSGRLFMSLRKGPNSALWGDFRTPPARTDLVRSDREYYGLLLSRDASEPVSGHLFYARPDTLSQRDSFRATDGSVFFLRRQDVDPGSVSVFAERRDPDTGRVIERRRLTEGADYEVSSASGVVSLRRPLASGGLNWVVVQYDWHSSGASVAGASYGGRAQFSPNERLSFGISGVSDRAQSGRQTVYGADARAAFGETGQLTAEYARSSGPGYDESISETGGLLWEDEGLGASGSGSAYALRAEGALTDYGIGADGNLSLYAGHKDAGFSTAGSTLTGRVREAGFLLETPGLRAAHDEYREDGEVSKRFSEVAVSRHVRDWAFQAAISRTRLEDADRPDLSGARTDLSLSADRQSGPLSYGVFASTSLSRSGEIQSANRLGARVGVEREDGLSVRAAVSGGAGGLGADVALSKESDGGRAWLSYAVDPLDQSRTREIGERDRGTLSWGMSRDLTDEVSVVAETTRDLIGDERATVSRYGLDYRPSKFWAHEVRLGHGTLRGDERDTDRSFVSWGAVWTPSEDESLSASIEGRRDDDGERVMRTMLASWDYRREMSEDHRLVFTGKVMRTAGAEEDRQDDYADVVLGYAWRPAHNDDLNLFVKYRYLDDEYGVGPDGQDDRQRQRSHVLSADATWDLDRGWGAGAKLGYRKSVSGLEGGGSMRNDAWMAAGSLSKRFGENWTLTAEATRFTAIQADYSETGLTVGAWRRIDENFSVGAGYHTGRFSGDLTDMTLEGEGLFLNVVAKF